MNALFAESGTSWLDRVLGLSRLSWSDAGARLGWEIGLPAWAWLLVLAAAAGVALWAYRGLEAPRRWRAVLGVLRAALLIWVVVLLLGPRLVLPQEQVERDVLAVLLDRSASMQVQDMRAGDVHAGHPMLDPGTAVTRDRALRMTLERYPALFGPEGLGREREIAWFGFDGGAYPLDPGDLPPAEGESSRLISAIEHVLDRTEGRPLSGIVILGDGRSPEPMTAGVRRRLAGEAVPVFTVPLGAPSLPVDVELVRVDVPRRAFLEDPLPVRAHVNLEGRDVKPEAVQLRLVDEQSGAVLDTAPLEAPGEPVLLEASGREAGTVSWRVEAVYEPGSGPGELVTDNNHRSVQVEFIDRPVRVLYVAGYPRWEYRYLLNSLRRQSGIESSVFLASADPGVGSEGDTPMAKLPGEAGAWLPFDVVILGDIPPAVLGEARAAELRRHVSEHGAGLIWIGGPRHTPAAWDGHPLAELLPMRRPEAARRVSPSGGPLTVRPTPAARALGVLALESGIPDGWPENLPGLYWVQAVGPLKPAAGVLAEAKREAGTATGDSAHPLVVRMPMGAGQVFYVATDETWRWRYGRGGLYFDRFWTQLVQALARSRVRGGGERAALRVSHRQVGIGQRVVLETLVRDPLLLGRALDKVSLEIEDARGDVREITLLPAGPGEGEGGGGDGDGGGGGTSEAAERRFETTWQPARSGAHTLRVVEPALAHLGLKFRVMVTRPDSEMGEPQADHQRLVALAERTGGAALGPGELEALLERVPNRSRRTAVDLTEPLRHAPLALALLLVLLTLEWALRKLVRLA